MISFLHNVCPNQHHVSMKMNNIKLKVTSGHMNTQNSWFYSCIYVHFVQLRHFTGIWPLPCRRKKWLPASPSLWEALLVASIGGGADDDINNSWAVVTVDLHILDRSLLVQPTACTKSQPVSTIWKLAGQRNPARTLAEECWDPPWGPECVFLCSLQSLLPQPSSAHPVLDLPGQIWTVRPVLEADNWQGTEIIHEAYLLTY